MLGDRGGEKEILPGFSPSFSRGVLPAPCRVRAKKSSGPAAASAEIAGATAGVRSTTFTVLLILAHSAFRSQQQAFELAEAGHRLNPYRLTPLPGFLSDLPAGFFLPIRPLF